MSKQVTLFGGPLDGKTIEYAGGYSVKVLSNVDYSKSQFGEFYFDEYLVPGQDPDVLVWSGMNNRG